MIAKTAGAILALLLLWSCARIVVQVGSGNITDDDVRIRREIDLDSTNTISPPAKPETPKEKR